MRLYLLVLLTLTAPTFAQDQPVSVPLKAKYSITDVTVFRERASVTRSAELEVQPGLWNLTFAKMPSTILKDSIQAKSLGDLKVVDLEYQVIPSTESNSEQAQKLIAELDDVREQISHKKNSVEVINSQIVFLNSMASRGSEEAALDIGTSALDTSVIENQLDFLGKQLATLLENQLLEKQLLRKLTEQAEVLERKIKNIGSQRGQTSQVVVTFVATKPTKATLQLTYLVNRAAWVPTYAVRADFQESTINIEYDAIVMQTTGENWNNVNMVLSTAQPSQAAEPPTINPYFVDIYTPPPPMPSAARGDVRSRAVAADSESSYYDTREAALEQFASKATVDGSGSAVTFTLPRTMTIASGNDQQQRTRIATFQNNVSYINIAIPLLTEEVYIKGKIENTSNYQFLPGTASIFVGNDYVGQSQIDSVAPSASYQFYFGVDPSIRAKRIVLEKRTDNTGLFSGGRETIYNVRIDIDNGADHPIDLELWDRWPVSRSSDITISMSEVSPPLSTDVQYVNNQKKQGLLRWDIMIPAYSTGDKAKIVNYSYSINRGKDIETTPLP